MPSNMTGTWSVDVIETLRAGWSDGDSCSQIAVTIWDVHRISVSRNAVIGKIHRLGLSRPTFATKAKRQKPERSANYGPVVQKINANRAAPAVKAEPFVCQEAVEIVPLHLSLIDLETGQCKWPFGNGPFTFCGNQTHAGASYCPGHHKISRSPTPPRKYYPRRDRIEARPVVFGGGHAA